MTAIDQHKIQFHRLKFVQITITFCTRILTEYAHSVAEIKK